MTEESLDRVWMYVGATLAGTEIRMDVRGPRPAWGLTGVERNEASGQFRGADELKVIVYSTKGDLRIAFR